MTLVQPKESPSPPEPSSEDLRGAIEEVLELEAESTTAPWCWHPPGHPNGDPQHWSVGEMFEDDPPIVLLVNWREEANAKLIARYRHWAPVLARALTAATKRLEEAYDAIEWRQSPAAFLTQEHKAGVERAEQAVRDRRLARQQEERR